MSNAACICISLSVIRITITFWDKCINSYYNQGVSDCCVELNGKRISAIVCLGTGTTFNVSAYKGYKSFTSDNFIIEPINMSAGGDSSSTFIETGDPTYHWVNINITRTKTYNASTGILTASYYCKGYVNSSQNSCIAEASKDSEVVAWLIY